MSAEIIQFIPRTAPKQSTDLVELGHKLIKSVSGEWVWDSDRTWSGEQTSPTYLAPPDDCA